MARVILDEMVDCEELFGYPFDDCQAIRIQLNQFLDKARLKKQEESPSVKPILAPPPRHGTFTVFASDSVAHDEFVHRGAPLRSLSSTPSAWSPASLSP